MGGLWIPQQRRGGGVSLVRPLGTTKEAGYGVSRGDL